MPCWTPESCRGNGIAGKVIQAGENAFLGYAQTTGEYGKLKCSIGLQGSPQHVTDKTHHFVIVPVLLGTGERNIVFVDEENGGLTPMSLEGTAESQKRIFKSGDIGLFKYKLRNLLFVSRSNSYAVIQVGVFSANSADKACELSQRMLKTLSFNIF